MKCGRAGTLLILGLMLAGCQANALSSATVGLYGGTLGKGKELRKSQPDYDTLAHEGGIVFLRPLEGIADPVRLAAATQLGVELGLALRAERAMRDATLLSSTVVTLPTTVTTAPATYQLLAGPVPPDGGRMPGPGDRFMEPPRPPKPWFDVGEPPPPPPGPGGDPHARARGAARMDAQDAQLTWNGLLPPEAMKGRDRHNERERLLGQRVGPELAMRAPKFEREGGDRAMGTANGGKAVATSFKLAADGLRTVTIERNFDASGNLVAIVKRLAGTLGGVGLDCELTRVVRPDGTETITGDFQLAFVDRVHAVRWSRDVSADGRSATLGSIARPSSYVTLVGTGTSEGTLTLTGQDAGVLLALQLESASGVATAVLDAGDAGRATGSLGIDESH